MKLTKQEQKAYDFLLESGATLKDVIEVVIKSNGITGVGLISLKNDINKQIDSHDISKFSEEALMSM
jgi:septin family protein